MKPLLQDRDAAVENTRRPEYSENVSGAFPLGRALALARIR
jgi:hypothetical protein